MAAGLDVIETGLALVEGPTFRPPDGATITFKGHDCERRHGDLPDRDATDPRLVRLELDPGFQADPNYDGNAEYYFNDPVWDPTGATLLYHTLEPAASSPAGPGFRIHVADVDAAGVVDDERLLEFDPVTDDEFHASFLPDGQTIVFETIEGADHQLWVGSTAVGASPRDLAVTAHDFIDYLVSPDGTQLIVVLVGERGRHAGRRPCGHREWRSDTAGASATTTRGSAARIAAPTQPSSSQRWGLDRSRSRPHSSQNASHVVPRRAVPAQLVGLALADRDAVVRRPQPGEVAVQQRLVPVLAEDGRQADRAAAADPRHLPLPTPSPGRPRDGRTGRGRRPPPWRPSRGCPG